MRQYRYVDVWGNFFGRAIHKTGKLVRESVKFSRFAETLQVSFPDRYEYIIKRASSVTGKAP
jgi:hypothetical protein